MSLSGNLKELIEERDRVAADLAAGKELLKRLDDAVVAMGGPLADISYRRESKVGGTVKFALDGDIFKSTVDKRVEYDSEALQSIAGSIPFEQGQDLFKVTFSISEAKYNSITDPELKQRITDARTVKYGSPKITLEAG